MRLAGAVIARLSASAVRQRWLCASDRSWVLSVWLLPLPTSGLASSRCLAARSMTFWIAMRRCSDSCSIEPTKHAVFRRSCSKPY